MPRMDQYDIKAAPTGNDQLLIIDVEDGSQSPQGTTKRAVISTLPGGGSSGINPPAGDIGGTAQAPTVVATHVPALSPVGLTGATAASRYVGATVSGAPASGTFLLGDFAVDQTGKIWICTTAGTPGTWTAAGPTIPVTIAQGGTGQTTQQAAIDALAGAQSAGKYLRSDGTHTTLSAIQAGDLPNVIRSDYKFAPEDHGAKADVIIVSDAAITVGTSALACITSTPFTSTAVDGGKAIYIVGAGAGGADYRGTISTVTDSGHAVLAANAGTTVSGAGCVFGTDNTAAINAALTAALAFGASSSREACLLFSESGYAVAGAPTLGGATLGNALFPLPAIAATGRKQRLRLLGPNADPAALNHWLQTTPQLNGPAIVPLSAPVAVDVTFGTPSVFGGPWNGYGGTSSVFSNMQVTVDGLSILAPWDSGYTGFDFQGVAEAVIVSGSKLAMATVPAATGWPQITNYGALTRTSTGLRMPDTNNNDRADILWWSTEGDVYGFMPSEHTAFDSVRAIYCFVGMRPWSSTAMAHGIFGRHLSAEACTYAISPMPSGVSGFPGGVSMKMVIDRADIEGTLILNDPTNQLSGSIGVMGNWTPAYGTIAYTGGSGMKVTDLMMPAGPVASPHAPPSSAAAWLNAYYKDAEVTLSLSGGTMTALSIDSVDQHIPANCVLWKFTLPSGHSYTPTYTGTLAHDVTLL